MEVHYQIQAAVDGGGVTGFEALARWPRNGGHKPAVGFIPVAEQYGLIDESVMGAEDGLRRGGSMGCSLQGRLKLSPVQLTRPGLAQSVAAVLEETGLPATRLDSN